MAPLRQQKDIELLLRWAYRDELSKRAISSSDGIWDQLRFGIGRDSGQRTATAAQRYPHFGLPDPDAEVVERHVSALPRVVIDWPSRGPFIMGEYLSLLDAHAALSIGTWNATAWVVQHAYCATRPPWKTEPPRCYPTPAARGPGVMIVGECRGHNQYSTGTYCPLRWDPPIVSIAIARAEYVVWHDALLALVAALAGKLERFDVTGPEASPNPWHNPDSAPVVLASRNHAPTRALPLKYPRPAPKRPRTPRLGQAIPRRA